MAKFVLEKNPASLTAGAALLIFIGMLAYALAASVKLGGLLYLVALAAIILGFWSKEDGVAILGVMGLCFLVMFDIALHIGVLG